MPDARCRMECSINKEVFLTQAVPVSCISIPSYPYPQFLINKTHQPGRPDHQELDVFEERWFFAFNFMAIELPDPGQHKNDHTEKPEGHDARTFNQVAEPETEYCKKQHTDPQGAGEREIIKYRKYHYDHGHINCNAGNGKW